MYKKWLQNEGKLIVTQPLSKNVPARLDYAATEGLYRLGRRVIFRKLYLYVTGQASLQRSKADKAWSRGLWIYDRTSNIGDALMDLAARSIFKEAGCTVDLLCKNNIRDLLQDDIWFDGVYVNSEDVVGKNYDFVIVQSVHHRALKRKILFFKSLPWVCIQGYYDVPDFARAKFGADRLCDLFSMSFPDNDWHERQKINYKFASVKNAPCIDSVVVVLGGLDNNRTYKKWDEVVSCINFRGSSQLVLVGVGDVARLQAKDIKRLNLDVCIDDKTNKTNISEVKAILSSCNMLICADGGLMHMGVACDVELIVGLFVSEIPPTYRLPHIYHEMALISETASVQDICPQAIVDKVNYFYS